jgi:hypothetical protein
MRSLLISIVAFAAAAGCSRTSTPPPANAAAAATPTNLPSAADPIGFIPGVGYRGFDRNDYPGDDTMHTMMTQSPAFAFTGYWLTPPPGETANSWTGKRELLKKDGWGFLLLANGRFDRQILQAQKSGTTPSDLGRKDAATAIAAATAEGFPRNAILFLDQEEGGGLLDEQATYLLAWTEAVAHSAYKPGVYASGERVQDDPGVWIDTIEDVRDRVAKAHLHTVAFFDALDKCPPAPGCTLAAKPLSSAGEPDLAAWQYSQSPRRPEITQSCAATYAKDNMCYAPNVPGIFLDMDVASSPDPSHAR